MPNVIDRIEREGMRKDVPDIDPGDTVRVHVKIIEGEKERIQVFEGVVIGAGGAGCVRPSGFERSPMGSAWSAFSRFIPPGSKISKSRKRVVFAGRSSTTFGIARARRPR